MTTIVCDGNYMIADHRVSTNIKTDSKYLKRATFGLNRFTGNLEPKENNANFSFSDSSEKIIDFRTRDVKLTFGKDNPSKIAVIGFSGFVSGAKKFFIRIENLGDFSKEFDLRKALPLLLDKCLESGQSFSLLILLEDGKFYKVNCKSDGTSTVEKGTPGEILMIGSGGGFINNTPFSLKGFSIREVFSICSTVDTYSSQSYSVFGRKENKLFLYVFPEKEFVETTWKKFIDQLSNLPLMKRGFNFFTGLNNPY